MFGFMKNFKPKDFIAILLVLGLITFKLTGHNGALDAIVALVVGYYFGRRDDATVNVLPRKE